MIRDVLQQLGGQIDVQSTIPRNLEGRGTTFKVNIPATLVRETSAQGSISANTDSLKILIVDDQPDVLKSLSDVARQLDHSCIATSLGVEAIEKVAGGRLGQTACQSAFC